MSTLLHLRPKRPIARQPIQCGHCGERMTEGHIVRNICPFLDSMRSPRAFLYCRECGRHVDFMVYRAPDAVTVKQIVILGVPGPEYVDVTEIEIKPAPAALGWYLDETKRTLERFPWDDFYLRNWLEAGINALCAEAGAWAERLQRTGAAIDREEIERFALEVSIFAQTPYAQVSGTVTIDLERTLGERFEPSLEKGRDELLEAARDLGETGYRVYHGRALDETWVRELFPDLLAVLARFAAQLPPPVGR